MDATPNSFHFAGQVPEVFLDGLTLLTTKDFVLFLVGLLVTAFFVESLQRISRGCHRCCIHSSQAASDANQGMALRPRRSDQVTPSSDTKYPTTEDEKSPCLATGRKEASPQLDKEECHSGKDESELGGDGIDGEKTSLVGMTPTVKEISTAEDTSKLTRRERMFRSLSITLMADRWEMLQFTRQGKDNSQQKVTWSRRLAVHILQTILRMVQMAFGFSLMLIVMTYNGWFFICVVGGAGLGYLIFSSDLERIYANYAETYVTRKLAEAKSKRERYTMADHSRKPSWKMRLMKTREKETPC